jgi:single-strand selective monofunctional uracil DNA glycosylase
MPPADALLIAGERLGSAVGGLFFGPPVTHVYNPWDYAWDPYRQYLLRYATGPKRVVYVGMNPGPYGMAQTGVPFGEVSAVRDFLGVTGHVTQPACVHPKRPVDGFACRRSEVSGRRLWGAIAARYGSAEKFFAEHFVLNYCPLVFMEESGRNRTPDQLPVAEKTSLFAACDAHLREVVEALSPAWVIGVGQFAEARARVALAGLPVRVGRISHPSPASPAANRGWEALVAQELRALGVCQPEG